MSQNLGLIKWFDNEKGFGTLVSTAGNEVFLHINSFPQKPEKVLRASALFFDIESDRKGLKATNISYPNTFEHFKIILQLIDKDPKVKIEVTLTGQSRWGNKYKRNEIREYSIFDYAIYQLLRNKDADTVKNYFINYFNENKWDTFEIIQKIFNVTRDIITKLDFNKTAVSLSEFPNDEIKNISNVEVIEEIFQYYLSNTKEIFLFDLWTNDDYYTVKKRSSYETKNYGIYFTIPDHVFLNSYKDINKYNINKLLESTDKEDICFKIISKHIADYSEINKGTCIEIIESINCLEETESFSALYNSIVQKNIDLLITNKDIENNSDDFKSFLEIINYYKWKKSKSSTIEFVNSLLSEEQIFKYWKETKYFNLPIDFIHKHLDKLSHNDFINAPLEFHNEYFLTQYNKLNFDNSLLSFCNLYFLLLETPGSQLQQVEGNLEQKYKAAILIYNLYDHKNNYYYNGIDCEDYGINFSKENFIKYLTQIDDLDEILQLVKIINEIIVSYNSYKPTAENDNGFYKFNEEAKTKLIKDIINIDNYSLNISVLDILKSNLADIDQTKNVAILKSYIPKFINPDDDDNFNELRNFNLYLYHDIEVQNQFYIYLQEFVSATKKIDLWLNNKINDIDFNLAVDTLKDCKDHIQFTILKRIFSSLHTNKKLITEKLYQQFENLVNNLSLNLNVRIALYVVNTLKKENQFINDKTIFELVSQRLNENVNDLIKIDEMIEKCGGRVWKAIRYNSNSSEEWYISINGHEFSVKDNQVNINKKSYSLNRENKSICIDGIYYNFKWIKKRNVFHTENYGIPDGLTFCDAVKSQFDEGLNLNFYWCCNSKCYNPCQKNYNPFQWEKYSLRDFIIILGIPFDNDLYYRFVSVVNRVNRLLEKLKCNSCNKLMRDAATSEFAFYRVNTFHCTDSNCNEYHKKVYLTHCLNWKCLNIIDTRISKACENGWYICEKCDNCCSQEKIDRRYQNLLTNAAFNPDNPRHQKLKFQVDNKLGHLERNEVYDFKTGEKK